MVTVHRAYGYRFVMFTNDHSPPHVHVFGQGGEAKIVLDDPERPRLDWVVGIRPGDMRRLMLEAERERSRLLEMWNAIHG
jgi:hypothetical protein